MPSVSPLSTQINEPMNKPRTDKMEIAEFRSLITNQSQMADSSQMGNPEFEAAIDRDFGTAVEGHTDGVSRRRWLQIMGASLALGSAAGCRYQQENVVEFAFRPQGRVPGLPEYFATMLDFAGTAEPLLATCYDGRPTKLDGNPTHPCSSHDTENAKFGAASAFTQARILEFYDPDRLRGSLKRDAANKNLFVDTQFDEIVKQFQPLLSASDLSKVAVLAAPHSSPTLERIQEDFRAKGGTWITYSSVSDDNTRAGIKQAFSKPLRARYHFDKAAVIVTLDADPFKWDAGATPNSASFARGRDAEANGTMSRLYSIESQFSVTGAAADHRLSVPSSKIGGFVAALAAAVDASSGDVDKSLPYRQRLMAAIADDLAKNKGKGIIIAGEKQPPEVHAFVHALNEKLGNHGSTIEFMDQSDSGLSHLEGIEQLASQLGSKAFDTLIIVGGNPVYDAPRELKIDELIRGVTNSLHLTLYKNETSLNVNWISHVAHPLETWKDGVAFDGSVLVGQPLMEPLFGGKSEIETLATLLGEQETEGQQLVRNGLKITDDKQWRKTVHNGFVEGSALQPVAVAAAAAPELAASDSWQQKWDGDSLELVFNPSPSVYDGQFANNSWLLELPNFFTKVCWDNVANVSPRTAEKLGLWQGVLVTLKVDGNELKIPVNVQPGQADGTIGLDIGWGRTAAGRVGGDKAARISSVGVDVNPLRKISDWHFKTVSKSDVVGTSTKYKLAIVQEPWTIDKTGKDEIQARMFRDKNKKSGDRSSLLREGSLASYLEFLERHPIDDHHHHHDDHDHSHSSHIRHADLTPGQLPVINPVAYTHDDDHDHDHDHGHHHHWPEAFHSHHEPFDITKGVRETYKESNPAHTNVWGKTIDLNKCLGCNACVIACQSENNIPVVGKDEAWRGRELHWIRIDRYYGDNLYTDDAEDDDEILVHQPIACHHCENAPCETVCPVAATTHSAEGLNDMIYNRCIGTRYCGNNCPFKVRRFNYLNYSDAKTFIKYPNADKLPPGDLAFQGLMMNPEVTVRSRGVMEKCTYCVQRIQNTKIQAKNERRPIGPNEITVACQDACPTGAIEFGDLNNKASRVAKKKVNPRAYVMLEDLNIYPRTKYLARVRNVHPVLLDRDDRDSVWKSNGKKA